MSENDLAYSFTPDQVEISFSREKTGLWGKLLGRHGSERSFSHLGEAEKELFSVMADLREWQSKQPDEVVIEPGHLLLSHDAVASLNAEAAGLLGLPPDVHLTLKTDVSGVLGRPDFQLEYEWTRLGRRVMPKRTGAIIETAEGKRRVPLWMKRALDLADNFDPDQPMEEHWAALAAFRRALEPEEIADLALPENREMAGLSMTAFLRRLEVRIANRFSVSPDITLGQFEVVPYSSRNLEDAGITEDAISESDAELGGEALATFQYRLRTRGARPAYQLGNNSYLVIDRNSAPVLEELARVQAADREERKAFIQNPRAFITEAVNQHLESTGAFEGLDPADQEEMIETIAGPAFVESQEYSERVTGVTVYTKPKTDFSSSGTAWLPEVFPPVAAEAIQTMPTPDLEELRDKIQDAISAGEQGSVEIGGAEFEATPARLAAIQGVLEQRDVEETAVPEEKETPEDKPASGPIILDTLDNWEKIGWHAQFKPRAPAIARDLPKTIITPLRQHQVDGFKWALKAWESGLPGVLNADEQGLGKTLQTLSFLAWLKENMAAAAPEERKPILIVAPTSLLRNWEDEVTSHVAERKFGTLVRLYGSALSGHKRVGAHGTETQTGQPMLDFDWLDEAFEDGRAHRYWILTTYTTLANYQHSLGRIPFAALVMDEIQAIKNKDTIASKAVEAMKASFRIGLTGTPIENTTMDLWTILDRLAPGALGSGSEFKSRYQVPDEEKLTELYAKVFKGKDRFPPLGLRRLKDDVARDLPKKTRILHPRLMPPVQAETYDLAQKKFAQGGAGAALKALHHIRSVSVHPSADASVPPDEFVEMSARLEATLEILKRLQSEGARALVFIEHRKIQFLFAELARYFFGLENVDIINGETPIPQRQAIVKRFQGNFEREGFFDLLILGPKAAGTGLTLTAATHVIHLSRWWNPAVEEQCNDRVHRIGQTRPVQVHIPMAIHPEHGVHSFDCLLQSLMQRKRRMAEKALWPMGDSKADMEGLSASMAQNHRSNGQMTLQDVMRQQFASDDLGEPKSDGHGGFLLP